MHKRYTQILLSAFLVLDAGVGFSCRPKAVAELTSPFRDQLMQLEQSLVHRPLSYAEPGDGADFRPENLYWEDGILWVWSKAQPWQAGFQKAGDKFHPVARRRGPLKTVKCRALVAITLCLGEREAGGLVAVRGTFRHNLPQRTGYADFDSDAARRVLVLDKLRGKIFLLLQDGSIAHEYDVGEGVQRVGFLDQGSFWRTSVNPPDISVRSLVSGHIIATYKLTAPVRDVVYDAERKTLWTVGPVDKRVGRAGGPIENLQTVLYGYGITPANQVSRNFSFDWRAYRLVDGTHLNLTREALYASATGSNRIFVLHLRGDTPRVEIVSTPTGIAPQGILESDSLVYTADRLSNTVSVIGHKTARRINLAGAGRGKENLGEILFFNRALWSEKPGNDFTCNSCHWDTSTDHRLHPGILEGRYEMTRPVAGMRMVAPVFTPMQALSLSDAVEGLFQTLDHRFWSGEINAATFFSEPLAGSGLSPLDARMELLKFLINIAPEPGPRRLSTGEFSAAAVAGSRIFLCDCASCHEPTENMRTRKVIRAQELLQKLKGGPLSFGAPLYRETGIKPYYMANGNRTSPLIALSRGGPFFSNGSAQSLHDVVEFFTPAGGLHNVHGSSRATGFYSAEEVEQLVEFLLSI